MERIFPPAFFNVMEHLPIHLPYEATVGGLVQYRWMYPFERFLHHLKKQIGNKARVEGSICNAYLTEEISNFCTHYFEANVDTKSRDMGRNVYGGSLEQIDPNIPEVFSSNVGYATTKGETRYLDDRDYRYAHGYVLSNCELLRDYERIFEQEMILKHPCTSINDVWGKSEHLFLDWLKQYVLSSNNIEQGMIKTLAIGPSRAVKKYNHYYVNGYNFHTYAYGKNKSTLNYGVRVKSHEGLNYYGILQEVIELMYVGETQSYTSVLFNCDWFDSGRGLNVHLLYKFVDVNHTKKYPKYDPFVLAYQAQQVYFAPCPSLRRDKIQWWVVFELKARAMIDAPSDQIAFQEEMNENPPQLSDPNEDVSEDINEVSDEEIEVNEEDRLAEDEEEFITESDSDDDHDEDEYENDDSSTSEEEDDDSSYHYD